MTPDELYTLKKIAVEPYANGFLLADYSGKRAEALYCGRSMKWRAVPVVRDPFDTQAEAIDAVAKA